MGANAIVTSVGTSAAKATGRPYQNHLFWDSVNSLWWLLVYTSTQTLAGYSSPDFVTWTAGAALTLTATHASEGRNLAVAFAALGSTAVIHVENAYHTSTSVQKSFHVRGTISGTTLTWGTEAQVASSNNSSAPAAFCGEGLCIDSNGTIVLADTYLFGGASDLEAIRSSNTDSGATWTAGWPANPTTLNGNTVNSLSSSAVIPYGVGKVFALGDNGQTSGTWKQLLSANWGGSSWSAGANVLSASLGTAQDANDWNAILVGSTIWIVFRTGSNTYGVRTTTNGTTFSTGTAPPNQTSLAGGGIGLATDGTNLWTFVIDSAAGNPVQYIKWDGTSWDASWTTLESSSATRTALSVYPAVSNSSIGVSWTQTNGSNNDVYGEVLSLGGAFTWQQLTDPFGFLAPWPSEAIPY